MQHCPKAFANIFIQIQKLSVLEDIKLIGPKCRGQEAFKGGRIVNIWKRQGTRIKDFEILWKKNEGVKDILLSHTQTLNSDQ